MRKLFLAAVVMLLAVPVWASDGWVCVTASGGYGLRWNRADYMTSRTAVDHTTVDSAAGVTATVSVGPQTRALREAVWVEVEFGFFAATASHGDGEASWRGAGSVPAGTDGWSFAAVTCWRRERRGRSATVLKSGIGYGSDRFAAESAEGRRYRDWFICCSVADRIVITDSLEVDISLNARVSGGRGYVDKRDGSGWKEVAYTGYRLRTLNIIAGASVSAVVSL